MSGQMESGTLHIWLSGKIGSDPKWFKEGEKPGLLNSGGEATQNCITTYDKANASGYAERNIVNYSIGAIGDAAFYVEINKLN